MAGYSGTPLVRKLGIKDTHVVLLDGAPEGLDLGDLGGALVVRRLPRAADVTLTFHTARASLAKRLPTVFERTVTDGMVWACWPKRPRSARPATRTGWSPTWTRTGCATSASAWGSSTSRSPRSTRSGRA